ncbi:hypothetical protein LTR84_001395 [Exophiala bonariae]|uniref:Metallo-beta-lactamase domain-containing protein n=1 Tax=Exophiala bonariae TaxID=1690606 RepID=A0AAV9NCM6_9EURO|nr:hypothetical protein LTR84_001395 [Exophiala bonariae]
MKFTDLLLMGSTIMIAIAAQPSPICTHATHDLSVYVYHLAPEPVSYQGSRNLTFSPTAFTLLVGAHSAVLVDAPATNAQGAEVASWVSSILGSDKTLQSIYITHGHGDHFFSARSFQSIYPAANILATVHGAEHVAQQYSEPFYSSFWGSLFGDTIDTEPLEVQTLGDDGIFHLEGHVLRAVEVGQGDTYNSTVLHVPGLDLVVGGDVVYGNCHQLFAEDHTPELRGQWLASLQEVNGLRPKVVIPSHTLPQDGYGAEHVNGTIDYIRAYEELLPKAKAWEELESSLKTRFPKRDGSFILRWSSQAPFNQAF